MKPTGNSPNIPNFHMHKESLKNIEPLVSCWSLKYWPHVGSMQMKWYVTSIFSSLSLASPTTAVVQFKTRCSNLWVSTVKMFNPFLGSFSKNVSILNQVFFPCRSDNTGKRWCYLKDVDDLIRQYRNNGHSSWNRWNTVKAPSPVSTTWPDARSSSKFNNKVFGYHVCGTPELSDYRYWLGNDLLLSKGGQFSC